MMPPKLRATQLRKKESVLLDMQIGALDIVAGFGAAHGTFLVAMEAKRRGRFSRADRPLLTCNEQERSLQSLHFQRPPH